MSRNSPSTTDFDIGPSSDYGKATGHHKSSQWSFHPIMIGLATVVLASLIMICLVLYVQAGECIMSNSMHIATVDSRNLQVKETWRQ